MTCIITGCNLIDNAHGRWVHGDLHIVGLAKTYVFNACMEDGESFWQYTSLPVGKCLVADVFFGEMFERRGVIVIANEAARLNDEAKKYLGYV